MVCLIRYNLVFYLFFLIIHFLIFFSLNLGSLPNSHQQIKSELMCQLINDNQIEDIISSSIETKSLELIDNIFTISSLLAIDQFSLTKLEKFWLNLKNI